MSNYNNLEPEDFIAAGYKKFPNTHNHASFGLQKTFRDEQGNKMFFLTLYAYDWTPYKQDGRLPESHPNWGFEPEVVFFTKDDEFLDGYRSIRFSTCVGGIEKLEKFYLTMYDYFGRVPDIHNN